jgi:trigger factor
MQLVSQQPADDGYVRLSVKAEPDELGRAVDEVYRDLARRAKIPGFRKGKAPRALLERQVGIEEARRMALEDLVEPALAAALDQASLEPTLVPKLEKAELEPDGSAIFEMTVLPRPQIELGPYTGLKAVRRVAEVTDQQVEEQLYKTRERYARWEVIADRPAEPGDLALVDYDLVIDGAVVEGQHTHGYPSQIGADTLFPELNDKLPGLRVGEQVRIPAQFPAEHREPSLAGKQGEYVVTLREIKRRVVPELSDEMARAAYGTESVEQLREAVRVTLETMALDEAEERLREGLLDQVMAASRVKAPAALVTREVEARLDDFETRLRRQGLNLRQYLREQGIDRERWQRDEEMSARRAVERMLVLNEIQRREGIEVGEQEVSDEIAAIARRIGSSPERVRKQLKDDGIARIGSRIERHKALQFLVDHAEVTDEGAVPALGLETDIALDHITHQEGAPADEGASRIEGAPGETTVGGVPPPMEPASSGEEEK